jgi:TetR/AcrR family transcriptional regulator, transcriptional repressor for nem operon
MMAVIYYFFKEDTMPKSSRHQSEVNRSLIVSAASRLFRQHGVDAVSVFQIMSEVGLTHGGFYSHFASKDQLVVEACAYAFNETAEVRKSWTDEGGQDRSLKSFAGSYLSVAHRDQPANGCPALSFEPDVARSPIDSAARQEYTKGIAGLVDELAHLIDAKDSHQREQSALAALCTLVGAMTLSRATKGHALSESLLEAAADHLSRQEDQHAQPFTASGN